MRPYVIRQGDYLTRLAHTMGFDPVSVWNDDENRVLRERRPNPDILTPGDILHVPDAPTLEPLKLSAGGTNKFKAKVPKVKVSVAFQHEGEPLKSAPYVI